MRVLVIEDDEVNAKFVMDGLKESGHNPDHAKDGMEGLYLATENKYDVLVVDRMLPKIDGITVVQTLRSSGVKTPVLILSALGKVDDKIKGLKSGGDDYLVKPYSFGELLARVEALVRRNESKEYEQTKITYGDLEMDLVGRKVKRAGKEIQLQNREFRILEFLMRRPGQVVTRTMMLEGIWDFHFDPQTNMIDAQISKIRQKIDKGFDKPFIQTIRGAGYKVDIQ